jgi:hypothetical protein
MDAKKLIELRKQAEKAVAEMPDGGLKLKAFEVILTHLLTGPSESAEVEPEKEKGTKTKAAKRTAPASTATGRILFLKDDGFFKTPKSIGEIRDELKANGWHYNVTGLSGPLQTLVQKRKLRRQRAKQGNRQIYKYTNP